MKIPRLRWCIAVMLCVASELNYLDRQTLSVLAQTIQDEIRISTIQYGQITSAFLISYTIMYAVSGYLVDRLGSRKMLLYFVSGWSIANICHAFARTALQFSICRFALGATEPASFPAGIKAVTEWFPMRERALAVGIFNSGTAIGAALAAPLIAAIALAWGWRFAFVFGGVLGLLWVVAWAIVYRLPREHPWLAEEELAVIRSDEAGLAPEAAAPVPLARLLRLKPVWGCIAARMLTDPVSYFFIFWTPKYLQQAHGFDLADVGKYSGIPFVALAIGNIVGGAVPSYLVHRGYSVDRARKSVMLAASCIVPVCCVLITRQVSPALAVTLISVAMLCHSAWASMTLPAEILPGHVVGSVTGLAGAMGGVMGIITQQLIGWTVQNISYTPVFIVSSGLHMTAFLLVCRLAGRIGTVQRMTQHNS